MALHAQLAEAVRSLHLPRMPGLQGSDDLEDARCERIQCRTSERRSVLLSPRARRQDSHGVVLHFAGPDREALLVPKEKGENASLRRHSLVYFGIFPRANHHTATYLYLAARVPNSFGRDIKNFPTWFFPGSQHAWLFAGCKILVDRSSVLSLSTFAPPYFCILNTKLQTSISRRRTYLFIILLPPHQTLCCAAAPPRPSQFSPRRHRETMAEPIRNKRPDVSTAP